MHKKINDVERQKMDQIASAGFAYCQTRGMNMGKNCSSYLCNPVSSAIAQ